MESKTKELVKAGHELVVLLGNQHGMIDAASLVQRLTAQLDITAIVLREKSKVCDQLAAENAALKSAGEIIRHLNANREEANFCGIDDCHIDDAVDAMITPATNAWQREQQSQAIRAALVECSDYLDTDCVMDRLDISYEDAEKRTSGAMELHDALVTVANRLRNGEAV